LLREQAAASRKEVREARRQVMAQVKKLMDCMNDGSRRNPQAASDLREESSGLHPGSPEYVYTAEKMDDFPVPLGVWISATEQRNAEYHAQERYRLIREQIFDALRPAARASRRKT